MSSRTERSCAAVRLSAGERLLADSRRTACAATAMIAALLSVSCAPPRPIQPPRDAGDRGSDVPFPNNDVSTGGDAHPAPAPATFEVVATGTIAAHEGTVWTWSRHHYVQRNGGIVLSEVWMPWILPGRRECVYGTNDDRVYVGPPRAEVARDMIPWAGHVDHAVLLDREDRVHRLTLGVLESAALTLPRRPRRSTQTHHAAMAVLLDDRVVWASTDGVVIATSLVSGESRLLATANVEVIAGYGNWAAFRDADTLWIADMRDETVASYPLTVDEQSARTPLAVGGDGVFVGGERSVVLRSINGESLRTIQLSDGRVHSLAADADRVYVLVDAAHARVEAHD